MMDQHRLDAIVGPTSGPAWVTDLVFGDRRAGYPHITVPMGMVHGLPVGVSFFGKAWTEPLLLKIAYAYEQASRHRVEPGFREQIAGD